MINEVTGIVLEISEKKQINDKLEKRKIILEVTEVGTERYYTNYYPIEFVNKHINPTFIVSIQLNIDGKEDKIFCAKTTSDFLVSKDTDKESLSFLFSLVKQAYSDFSNHFYHHTHKTELSRFSLVEPVEENFQKVLIQIVSRYSDGDTQISTPVL